MSYRSSTPAAWKKEVMDHEELFIELHDHLGLPK